MIKVTGIADALSMLNNIAPAPTLKKALFLTGHKIIDLAEPKLPVKDGILKGTDVVIEVGNHIMAGYNSEYGAYQHEGRRQDGTRIIKLRPGGGESFFLSSTVEQNMTQLVEFAQEQVEKQIKQSQ
jgi:hypothetical protein